MRPWMPHQTIWQLAEACIDGQSARQSINHTAMRNSVKVPRKTSNPRNSITPCSPYLYEAYKVDTTIPEQEKCDLVRFLLNIRLFEGENIKNNQCQTPCAVWHHSRPHRRPWTIPAVLDIYIPQFVRSATQTRGSGSRLRSPAISSELDAISPTEIAADCGRSQSRPGQHI